MLLPPNAEPHNYALSPGDLKKIARADVIVENGLGAEAWLDKVLTSGVKLGAVRITASTGIGSLGGNPHVWLDPIFAIREVEAIRDGLKKADPPSARVFEENAARYIRRLQELDASIRAATEKMAVKNLLTTHDSLRYFCQRYGFELVAVVEMTPGQEPTPKYVRHLREIIAQRHVRAIFTEPQTESQAARSLSRELGITLVPLDPMESGDAGADYYEKTMKANLESLSRSLRVP
jgi:zinc/manganese transport system substrate-binding protein